MNMVKTKTKTTTKTTDELTKFEKRRNLLAYFVIFIGLLDWVTYRFSGNTFLEANPIFVLSGGNHLIMDMIKLIAVFFVPMFFLYVINNKKGLFTKYHATLVLLIFMFGQAGGVYANINATQSVKEARVMLQEQGYTYEESEAIIMDSVPKDHEKIRFYVDFVSIAALFPYLFSLLSFFIFRFIGGLGNED